MKRYLWILGVMGLIAGALFLGGVSTVNITPQADLVKETIMPILAKRGLSYDDMLFFTKGGWKRLNVKGFTYTYVSKPYMEFDDDGLAEEVKTGLSDMGGYVDVRTSLKGIDGSFVLTVLYDGYAVFSVTLKKPLLMERNIKEKSGKAALVVPQALPEVKKAATEKPPMVAFVLDDFGYSNANLKKIKDLGIPVTLAVLPNLKYTREVCSFSEKNGIDNILHLPMEPITKIDSMENDTIMVDMPEDKIRSIVSKDLESVYTAQGVNNHMGSQATQDPGVMGIIFDELKKRDMFFMDSVTVAGSVCGDVAEKDYMRFIKRDVFIDHVMKEDEIEKKLGQACEIAIKKGAAVAIGHDRALTIDVLKKSVPRLKAKGVKFVRLADLVNNADKRP